MHWESRQDPDAQNSYTKHYVYEPNRFVPLLQAGYQGFIKLISFSKVHEQRLSTA
ncbi:hypothetical protein G8E00_07915 [Acinetobacter shaoyimingii]|uniref:Uncharacterized protein n=1 Tax=Acinetobacter shaoyimingii TaxID=2715164 RepID=A0A6G8RRN6_9GAMM|nr:hypothetical protein G8E00_07915 [Acinetobacter shaoyimingii]